MGLPASVARMLMLTAEMANTEYEGQQINQERLTLTKTSANLYSRLQDMEVPTAPSPMNYTREVSYFDMGSTHIRIMALRPSPNGRFNMDVSYETPGGNLSEAYEVGVTRNNTTTPPTYSVGQYQVYTLQDALEHQEITPTELNGYIAAIRHFDPELADPIEHPASEIAQLWSAYFPPLGGDTTVKDRIFMRTTDLQGMHNDTDYVQTYSYNAGGTYTAYQTFANVEVTFGPTGTITQLQIPTTNSTVDVRNMYTVTTTTETNDEAYNNAMEQYNHDKYLYDKEQNLINQKLDILQQQDRSLNLQLTQLDTKRNALNTEMDAVKKVIQDATDKGFKTFSG